MFRASRFAGVPAVAGPAGRFGLRPGRGADILGGMMPRPRRPRIEGPALAALLVGGLAVPRFVGTRPGLHAPGPQGAPSVPVTNFPAFVWRGGSAPEDAGQLALLRPFGGTQLIAADGGDWVRSSGLDFFVFNAPGRDELHLEREDPGYRKRWRAWYEGRDDVHLEREPCLTDPDTRQLLLERLSASLAARDGDCGWGVSLGDEVSLTPAGSPEDVCLSPTCRRAWTRFLAGRAELGETDRRRLADLAQFSTDRARIALAEGDTEPIEGWLLRRDFHHAVLVEVLTELARTARAQAPTAPLGLLGLSGRTAFGNVGVAQALELVDFIECYPVGNAGELAFTLRRPGIAAWATVFPSPEQPHDASRAAWMHWLRGGDGLVVWSERELAAHPNLSERLARTVHAIRALDRRFPDFRPTPRGVALVDSPRSVAIAWLRDALLDGPTWPRRLAGLQEREGTLERSRRAWLRFFEDQGLMPGALPFASVEAETVQRFPVLVLTHTLVVSADERRRLEEFLAAGGTLVVQGELGWLDGRGRPRAEPLVVELLEHSPRVLVVPEVIDEYPDLRLSEHAARREVLEQRLWAYLNGVRSRLGGAPFRLRGPQAEAGPWLISWVRERKSGGYLCAALPTPMVEKASRGHGLPVRVEPRDDLSVQWLHPAPGDRAPALPADRAVCPPGEAIVFLLARPQPGD